MTLVEPEFPEFNPGDDYPSEFSALTEIDKLAALAHQHDGIVKLTIYPDGSGNISIEKFFNNLATVESVIEMLFTVPKRKNDS